MTGARSESPAFASHLTMLRFFHPITADDALTQQRLALAESAAAAAAVAAQRQRADLLRPKPGRPRGSTVLAPPPDESAHIDEQPAPKRGKYENWFTTPFIHDILDAYRKTGNSARKAVEQLRHQYPCRATEVQGRYDGLSESTVRSWFGEDKKLLPKFQAVLDEHSNVRRGQGFPSILSKSPAAEQEIKTHLQALRDRGAIVNTLVIKLVVQAVLRRITPDLLEELQLSKMWCSRLATEMMGWSWRVSTSAASKLPNDWRTRGIEMAKRIAYNVQLYKIHPSMIVNVDQTGVRLVAADNKTYDTKCAKSVKVIGNDDKRQITACIASSADGDLLPLQLIFEGKTKLSEPKETEVSKAAGVHITHSENHWSSQETMQQWVTEVLVPYADRCILKHNRPKNDHIVLVLDVWSVPISQEFRDWIKVHHPRIHLVYVPPNCTSELQVADVILQRSFKAGIRKEFNKWAAEIISEQLKAKDLIGLTPHLKMGVIKPLVMEWCVHSWNQMQAGRLYIKMGWHTCCVSLYNIWSPEKRVAVMEEVARKEFEAEHVPTRHKGAAAAAEDINEDKYESESSDDESDQLDIMKQRQYGKRSTRIRKRPQQFGYQLDSSQMEMSGDEGN